jgi:NAD+ diphosphatase
MWFIFRRNDVLVTQGPSGVALPACFTPEEIQLVPRARHSIGLFFGRPCFVADLEEAAGIPDGLQPTSLRSLFAAVDEPVAALAGRAYQIKEWHRNCRFCGRCGGPTEIRATEQARTCAQCRYTTYPPVTPAVMVLITRGRELLLARRPTAEPGRYSALAGFVEPGEMLEDTVRRETREEVGVEVDAIRYFGSQPWPFPHSLMIAFTAQYAGGDVRPDGVEIEDARWFAPGQLPNLPPKISISRRLIDAVAKQLVTDKD